MYFLAGVRTEISGFLLAIGQGLSQLLGAAYMTLDPIDNSLHGCLLSSKLARVCLFELFFVIMEKTLLLK